MPATPLPVSIRTITEESVAGTGGSVSTRIRVTFNVGGHGPFVETFPKADFNAATVLQKLNLFAQELNALPVQ